MLALVLALASLLPAKGVLVPRESLAGVRLGDTAAQVRTALGPRYVPCGASCPRPTWFYFDDTRESGLAVAFRARRVVAVYTLGSPRGWRTSDGLRIGRIAERLPRRYAKLTICTTSLAHSERTARAVTTIYVSESYVTGFALSLPSEPVCR